MSRAGDRSLITAVPTRPLAAFCFVNGRRRQQLLECEWLKKVQSVISLDIRRIEADTTPPTFIQGSHCTFYVNTTMAALFSTGTRFCKWQLLSHGTRPSPMLCQGSMSNILRAVGAGDRSHHARSSVPCFYILFLNTVCLIYQAYLFL